MSLHAMVALLLGLGVLLALLRLVRRLRQSGTATRNWTLVLLLQPAVAVLLYFSLFPPPIAHRVDRLVLATAGTTPAQVSAHADDGTVFALPEAPALAGIARVPDLGTALRRHPQATQLIVLGQGLATRDRDAARGLPLQFVPAALPRGLIELQSPPRATLGARWQVSGTVNALPGGAVELLDPAGRRARRAALAKDGRFVVHGQARAPGRARFELRVRDARGKTIEQVPVPIQIEDGSPARVLVLAGGPGPELKYLRRWAVDAGLSLHTQISVGAGLRIGDPPVAIDAASLRNFDLVILDERAWRDLGGARKAALREALRDGLGVLLRITGPLSPGERRELQTLGFTVEPGQDPPTTRLPPSLFDASPSAAMAGQAQLDAGAASTLSDDALVLKAEDSTTPTFPRQPLRVLARDGSTLLRDHAGRPLAAWRNEGQGRMALWWLGDTYQLVLSGQAPAHGRLWSQAFMTVARARGGDRPWLQTQDRRPHQRLVACGLVDGATVHSPDGQRTRLLIEKKGDAACAAYWPTQAGWHVLRNQDAQLGFAVRAPGEAPGLRAQADREATQQLVLAATSTPTSARSAQPGPRLPWFLGWLLASAALWWLERRWLR